MTESCLSSQMTGYNTYFSLLKAKVDKLIKKQLSMLIILDFIENL